MSVWHDVSVTWCQCDIMSVWHVVSVRSLKVWLKNDVSVTSYSQPFPIQIYILHHVLYYVFASGLTLLHSFWEFEKWCQCDILLTAISYANLHIKYVLYHVFASGLTLLHSFWDFETLLILIFANVSHIFRWCQCDTKLITCLLSSISWEWIQKTYFQ